MRATLQLERLAALAEALPTEQEDSRTPEQRKELETRKARWRQLRVEALNPDIPNRQTFACIQCLRRLTPGQPFALWFNPITLSAQLHCLDCAKLDEQASYAPVKRQTIVKDAA